MKAINTRLINVCGSYNVNIVISIGKVNYNCILQVAGLKLCRTEQLDNGEWIEDSEQITQLKCNYIISAFGSGLYDSDGQY